MSIATCEVCKKQRKVKDSPNAIPKMCRTCYLARSYVGPTLVKCERCGETRKLSCSKAKAPKICRQCHLDRQALVMARMMRRKPLPALRSRSPQDMA